MRRLWYIMPVMWAALACGCGETPHMLKELFHDYRDGSAVQADHGVLFYGIDKLSLPGQPVVLEARLRSPRSFRGLENVTISFEYEGRTIGQVVTDGDGMARLVWKNPPVGLYEIQVRPMQLPPDIDEDYQRALGARANMLIDVCRPQTPFVVVDLDHTLVDDDWYDVLTKDKVPTLSRSPEVLRDIASRYHILYLTQRPEALTAKSKQWLSRNHLPPGVLQTGSTRQTMGSNRRYKSSVLAGLRKTHPGIQIGIGDRVSDAQAYLANGMTAYLIPASGPTPSEARTLARDIRLIPSQHRLQVVRNWTEIEQGVLARRRFEGEAFAKRLDAYALSRSAKRGEER